MAHPLKVKLIAEARIKTDKLDAWALAQLLRTGFLPESYRRPIAQRRDPEILRQRMFFVRQQTQLKNRLHGLVDRQLEIRDQAMMFSDLFGRRGLIWWHGLEPPEPDQSLLQDRLQALAAVRGLIGQSDQRIDALRQGDGRIGLLEAFSGIGRFFAALIVVEIGDINRFRSAKKLCRYAGLVPSTYRSAQSIRHGRLTKPGNKYLRWALIEAVNHRGGQPPLGQGRDRRRRTKSRNTAKTGHRPAVVDADLLSSQGL